jgi:hypothetical protein
MDEAVVVIGFLAFLHSLVSKIEYVHIGGSDDFIDERPVGGPIGSKFVRDPNSIITCNAVGLILQRRYCALGNSVISAFETYVATPQNENEVDTFSGGEMVRTLA